MITELILGIAFLGLLAATVTDIKTREVPDWLSYGLIFIGIGIRGIYIALFGDYSFFIYGIAGLAVFAAVGYLMFYSGQWGGGDTKLLMGIGSLVGARLDVNSLLVIFFVNLMLAGGVYGLLYSVGLAIANKKEFSKNFKNLLTGKLAKLRKIFFFGLIFCAILMIVLLLTHNIDIFWLILALTLTVYLSFYLLIFVKAVELSAMYKYVEPSKITEGDWIAKEYKYKGKHLCGPKDLGISSMQIKKLETLYGQGKLKKIKVKYGIPFVPSFLIAFIIAVALGPWWLIFA